MAFAEPPEQKMTWQEEEEKALKRIPSIQSLIEKAQKAWESFTELIPGAHIPYTQNAGRKLTGLMKKVPDNKQMVADSDTKIKDIPDATYKERDEAIKAIDQPSLIFKDAHMLEQEAGEYLSSKRNPVCIKISKDDASELGISETVCPQLANLPPIPDEDNDIDNGEESETDITQVQEPLHECNIPMPSTIKSSSDTPTITKIDVSLQHPLKFNIEPKDDKPDSEDEDSGDDSVPQFDDMAEPNMMEMDVDAVGGKGKAKETGSTNLACKLCPDMPWQKQTPFSSVTNLKKHKRGEHDAWGNLEREMATDDPDVFQCPGFQKIGPCKTHCWKACPNKACYLPLKEAHIESRPGRSKDMKGGPKMAQDIHSEFTGQTGALQGWANQTGGLTE
ncbi:hypothetical protein V565_268820, partial [Rhizoctonia solani 123E]